jgi:hypothetical protein
MLPSVKQISRSLSIIFLKISARKKAAALLRAYNFSGTKRRPYDE